MASSGELPALVLSSKKNKPSHLSMEGLQRTISDISLELFRECAVTEKLEPISEVPVEDAKCECCGLLEECTAEYIRGRREKFYGKLICGLCGEAVKEEMEKKGRGSEEALKEHVRACERFIRVDRKYPVLYQAEAFKEMLKRSSGRTKSTSPRDRSSSTSGRKDGGLARSSSCIPAISRDVSDKTMII